MDQLPIELMVTLLSVVEKLPKNLQVYWARNEELLLEALNKVKEFEPLTRSPLKPYILPETKETTRGILWRKRLIDRISGDDFFQKISKEYSVQPQCSITSLHINVNLRAAEFFEELCINSANDLASNAFSYPQIVSLCARHTGGEEKKTILFYEGANYFPLLLPTGEVEFISFFSRRAWRKHTGWRGWFVGNEPFFGKGQLLLNNAKKI